MSSSFRDPDFQDKMVAFLCRDRNFLKQCSLLLDSNDFKPRKHEGPERWIIATAALEYWRKYREKIGNLLRSEMLDFARKQNLGDSQKKSLLMYCKKIRKSKLVGVDHIVDRVTEYKQERMKMDAIEKLIELQGSGELTTDRWLDICREAVEVFGGNTFQATEYFDEEQMDKRIDRRDRHQTRKFPLLFIDPLDEAIRVISYGHLGLIMAPYKKGKSLFMAHIAMAYTLQGLNVLYFTLEDPQDDVEDRMDAMITHLPLKRLHDLPKKVKNRFMQYKRLVRGRLRIIDGTEGAMSVAKIREIYERERNTGFDADAVLVDYDDFIVPSVRRKERRQEFSDIYIEFGNFIRKQHVIGWFAAQTVRKTENRKVISGDTIAEDISKIRKVSCALGIGQGDYGEESLYLYVAAHRYDRQKIGWNICTNRPRMVFYDRDATMEKIKAELAAQKKDSGEEES